MKPALSVVNFLSKIVEAKAVGRDYRWIASELNVGVVMVVERLQLIARMSEKNKNWLGSLVPGYLPAHYYAEDESYKVFNNE